LDKLANPLNCFLAACYEVFNKTESLEYDNTRKAASYLSIFNSQFINPILTKRLHKRIKMCLFLKARVNILYKSIIYKEYRVWLLNIITHRLVQRKINSVRNKKVESPNNSCLLHK
jgi:hypothetical protein